MRLRLEIPGRELTMRVLLASDDSGSLKEIIFNRGTNTSIKTALQPFHIDIHLNQGLSNRIDKIYHVSDSLLLLARHSGSLELVSSKRVSKDVDETNEPKYDVTEFELQDLISGLFDQSVLDTLSSKSKKKSKIEDQFVELYLIKKSAKNPIFLAATKSGNVTIIEVDLHSTKISKIASHKIKAPVEFVTLYDLDKSDKFVMAYGGEENLVRLIELSSDFKEISDIWAAKNVPFDNIGLRVPAWDVALRFLESEKNGVYNFITITKYAQLRKYSTNAEDCRPVQSITLLPKGEQLNSCKIIGDTSPLGNFQSSNFDELEFLAADSRKDVYQFNGKGRLLRKIAKGDITGFASCIAVTDKYLLQGGLDRYVRIFDLADYKLLAKIFTGGKVSDIILLEDNDLELPLTEKQLKMKKKKEAKRSIVEADEDAENEDLWNKLESKKRKVSKNDI